MNCKKCAKQYICNKEKCKPVWWHKTKRVWNTRKEEEMEENYKFKVADLIAFYNRGLFEYISIEFRNKNNYMIKNVKYGSFEDYIKNEDFKEEEVKEFFFRETNNLVILINRK